MSEPPNPPDWWMRWKRVDDTIYRIEAIAVTTLSIAMCTLVFAAVYLGLFNTHPSVPVRIARGFNPDLPAWIPLTVTGISWLLILWSGCARGGIKGTTKSLAAAAALWVGSWGLGYLLLRVFPTGIPSYQSLAMALFVWVMLLGGSMAAYQRRHLTISATQRLVSQSKQRIHAGVSNGITALFAWVLAWVSAVYVMTRISNWVESGFSSGLIGSTQVPAWAMTLAVPVGFFLIGLRFASHSGGVLIGALSPYPQADQNH